MHRERFRVLHKNRDMNTAMHLNLPTALTPDTPHRLRKPSDYRYVRTGVRNAHGTWTTISLPLKVYEGMLRLARGIDGVPAKTVGAALRAAAAELAAEQYAGMLSPAVRDRALRALRGAHRPDAARAFDASQFPDGIIIDE